MYQEVEYIDHESDKKRIQLHQSQSPVQKSLLLIDNFSLESFDVSVQQEIADKFSHIVLASQDPKVIMGSELQKFDSLMSRTKLLRMEAFQLDELLYYRVQRYFMNRLNSFDDIRQKQTASQPKPAYLKLRQQQSSEQ